MGGVRILAVFLLSAFLVSGPRRVDGQATVNVIPDQLKPELLDPVFAQLGLAFFLTTRSASLPVSTARLTYLFGVSAYDALAVYSDHLDGIVVGGSLRRPPSERTLRNKQTAIAYSVYRLFLATYPDKAKVPFDNAFAALGFNPNDTSTDPATAVGMGNIVGKALVDYFLFDGYNQLGNRPNVTYNRLPAADYTGYKPKNTAFELKYPSRWQPLPVVINNEYTVVQNAFGLQLAEIPMLSGHHPSYFKIPKPKSILKAKSKAYKREADLVLAASAALNDTTKMLAEGIDGGFAELGATFLANKYNWTLDKQVMWNFVRAAVVMDSQIPTAYWKRYFDTVRPASVVRSSGLFSTVQAWGGPFKGTVTMKASEWRQYNYRTDPSPEYPSGACSLWATYAAVARSLLGTDEFGWSPVSPPGISGIEPGMTPSKPVQFHFSKFSDLPQVAIDGRLAGGVHFPVGTAGGVTLGDKVGVKLYEKLATLFKCKHL